MKKMKELQSHPTYKSSEITRLYSEHSANIRIWITLHVPKIEDGNNFGVSVQEDTLAELRQVEAECAQYLDQISRYYLTR